LNGFFHAGYGLIVKEQQKQPLSDLAELKIGDVVKLDTEKGDPAVVFIGERPKYLARPGLQGNRRAVQIVEGIHGDDEDRFR
jgi:flagellar motor switch protein FliM